MARRHWRSGRPVKDVLSEEPYRFDPFQAARLLEALRPMAEPLATGSDPGAEAMRFVGAGALGFPASALVAVEGAPPPSDDQAAAVLRALPPEVKVAFMDLVGQNGPLPHAYTEMVRDRLSRRDKAMKAFLDMFVHRLVSVMIRAKRHHMPGLDNRHPDQGWMTSYLKSVIGIGTPALAQRLQVPDRVLLRYAALFAHRPRSAVGLTQILTDMIKAPVRAHLVKGAWLPIAQADQTHLANARGWGGQNARLGRGAVLGTKAWTQTEGLTLEIGPLTLEQFHGLLPGGKLALGVASVIRFYLEQDLDVSLQLILQRSEMPRLRLTRRGSDPDMPAYTTPGSLRLAAARLGQTSWISTRVPRQNDHQVTLTLPSVDEISAQAAQQKANRQQADRHKPAP